MAYLEHFSHFEECDGKRANLTVNQEVDGSNPSAPALQQIGAADDRRLRPITIDRALVFGNHRVITALGHYPRKGVPVSPRHRQALTSVRECEVGTLTTQRTQRRDERSASQRAP